MVEITWAPQAEDDFEAICAYIARDSEIYASIFAQRVFKSIERLVEFPQIGRIVPEKHDERIRELILSPYRIIYRFEYDTALIVAIIHGSRRLEI
jgi:toxin ParE1/3/4